MIILHIFWGFFLEDQIFSTHYRSFTIYNNFDVKWSVIKHLEDIKPQKYLSKNKKARTKKSLHIYLLKLREKSEFPRISILQKIRIN